MHIVTFIMDLVARSDTSTVVIRSAVASLHKATPRCNRPTAMVVESMCVFDECEADGVNGC